jgi:hypothetical protein
MSRPERPVDRRRPLTRFAVAHPYLWAIATGSFMAIWGLASIGDLRAVIPASVGVAVVNWVLWRPGGRGHKWASDRTSSS